MSNLSERLRPKSIDEVIGQDAAKRAIQSFAEKGNWPSPMLFYGPPGCGKTTMAKIIAAMIQPESAYVHEFNASVVNKVDDARELEELLYARPFNGQPRVVICNEADRYTPDAQKALKDPLEMSPAIVILTSNVPEKIDPAIKSRAAAATFEFGPLTTSEIGRLLQKAIPDNESRANATAFFQMHDIRYPREILGIVEQHLAGVPLDQCIHGVEHEPLYKDLAGAVTRGDWKKSADLLSKIPTADFRGMISVVSAFLASSLLKEPIGPKADALSTCLVGLGNSNFADGVAYASTKGLLYKCAKAIGGTR